MIQLNASQFAGMCQGLYNTGFIGFSPSAASSGTAALLALSEALNTAIGAQPSFAGSGTVIITGDCAELSRELHERLLSHYVASRYPLNQFSWDRNILNHAADNPNAFGAIDKAVRYFAYGVLGAMHHGTNVFISRVAIEENWRTDGDQWFDDVENVPDEKLKTMAEKRGAAVVSSWTEQEDPEVSLLAYMTAFKNADAPFDLYTRWVLSGIYTFREGIANEDPSEDVRREIEHFKKFAQEIHGRKYAHLAEALYLSMACDFRQEELMANVERYAEPMMAVENHLKERGFTNPAQSVIASAAFFLSMGLPEALQLAIVFQAEYRNKLVSWLKKQGVPDEMIPLFAGELCAVANTKTRGVRASKLMDVFHIEKVQTEQKRKARGTDEDEDVERLRLTVIEQIAQMRGGNLKQAAREPLTYLDELSRTYPFTKKMKLAILEMLGEAVREVIDSGVRDESVFQPITGEIYSYYAGRLAVSTWTFGPGYFARRRVLSLSDLRVMVSNRITSIPADDEDPRTISFLSFLRNLLEKIAEIQQGQDTIDSDAFLDIFVEIVPDELVPR